MAEVSFRNLHKRFPDGTVAVVDFSLGIADGEFMVLVGPSGCGKTTVLRTLAGIERATSGEVAIGERVVNDLTPQDRDIAMVFQNYALYANMSVFENLAFSLRNRGMKGDQLRERVERAAATLAITEFLDRKPATLSGGQRQRVAIGRAIVRDPAAFLMDEPLSNLDAKLRGQMRAELTLLHRELGATVLYVTHDQVEAMTMADRVAVMWQGIIQQVGVPSDLYERPDNLFVASFIGAPPMNFLAATAVREGSGMAVQVGSTRVALDGDWLERHRRLEQFADRPIVVGVRPEHFEPANGDAGALSLDVNVDVVERLGYAKLLYFDADVEKGRDSAGIIGRDINDVATGRVGFAAQLDADSPVKEGRSRLSVPARRLHAFDPETGEAIADLPD